MVAKASRVSVSRRGGWNREQALAITFFGSSYHPLGAPGRYPAQTHEPAERISRPGATSDFGRIGHFAGAAYAFLAKMVKMSSQSC